ncbi:DNA polymerase-1 [Herbihabitans rhizosphaerae]|uniref:DNA polymerase I n=1 Tax=Herbihabitans rhizosphaerae TaxID=1872711 RepID=A0A4Q7KUK7_9PSEU|nr:DNA polymerase [Herbihabitans rhizosphaerae]RZS39172.1 DNA polymerase-1 [Herbihabitans rhizosphaerae]
MREHTYRIDGAPVAIRVIERTEDLDAFRVWLNAHGDERLGFDTESTGLDFYAPSFRLRTAQFGDARSGWVLPVDSEGGVPGALEATAGVLRRHPCLVIHNAPFDALVVDAHVPGVELTDLWPRVVDTKVRAHLIDPRGPQDPGGVGQSLDALTRRHLDAEVAREVKGSMVALAREIGTTKEKVWREVDLYHPTYTLYAGMDPILATRLFDAQADLLDARAHHLEEFESAVGLVCARMRRVGMPLDVEYTEQLSGELAEESEKWAIVARRYGITSVNAPKQIASALVEMGEELTETTDSGGLKVDKEVLMPLADLNRKWELVGAREPNPLAEAVLRSKRAGKWRTSYAEAMLAIRDADDRVHPDIASLQARTARMSISKPPLQQLPSSDATIRRALLAEPGHVIGAVDYAAVEMRVLAALADETVMIDAIREGRDLHGYTAELIYGPDYTDWHRKICKGVGFGKVYGGGATTLSRQTGAPIEQVREAIEAYDKNYRGVKRYSRRLQQRAEFGRREVVTPAGRRLPLDRDRLYAATNYMVQSTSRDVLAEALLRLDEKGLTEFLRLPVHDEVVFSAPEKDADEIGREIARTMRVDSFFGVPLDTELTIGGRSWGTLYINGEHRKVEL